MWRTLLLSGALLAASGCAVSPPPPASGGGDTAPPTADAAPDARARVAVHVDGEDLHLEVRTIPPASAPDAGPPGKVRCALRLCRQDGTVAGPASGGASDHGRAGDRNEWVADFTGGEEATLHFRRESDGMFWRVVVVPDLSSDGVRWRVVTASLLCIR